MHPRFFKLLRFYPPFLGAGVSIREVADDGHEVVVDMRLRFWNRNTWGAHFGGSLYAMCDPFFALILIAQLGPEYIVWDKAASIDFKRPGKGRVSATFRIERARVSEIKRLADTHGKTEPEFRVDVLDEEGKLVAQVDKRVYVRKKKPADR
jgi:acyl-coenzyme A thioesterase PaaI-like protein